MPQQIFLVKKPFWPHFKVFNLIIMHTILSTHIPENTRVRQIEVGLWF